MAALILSSSTSDAHLFRILSLREYLTYLTTPLPLISYERVPSHTMIQP